MSSLSKRKSLQLAQLKVWSMFIKPKAKLKVCARNRFSEQVIFVWLMSSRSVANEQSPTNDRMQLGARIPGSRPPQYLLYLYVLLWWKDPTLTRISDLDESGSRYLPM
jgi:hypothetical protein